MPTGGRLTLETRNLDNQDHRTDSLPPGDYIHIAVRDEGEGMTAEVLDRAFEPFFTTKPKGHGTGLGLATAYGIIRQASGDLVIESTPGHGTIIHIYLPATDQAVTAEPSGTVAVAQPGKTILLADDEDGVREVASRILTKAGYHVLAAANGREALDVARQHRGPIHGVLSDVLMPYMDGRELAEALDKERPDTPVLFMSGFADPLMTDQGLLDPGVTVVSKPFTKIALLSAIQKKLSEGTLGPVSDSIHESDGACVLLESAAGGSGRASQQ